MTAAQQRTDVSSEPSPQDLGIMQGALLPVQLGGGGALWKTGERQLLAALLRDSIECFNRGAGAGSRQDLRLALEAEEWITARDDPQAFSFENVCRFLELEPEDVRDAVFRQRGARHVTRAAALLRRNGRASATPRSARRGSAAA